LVRIPRTIYFYPCLPELGEVVEAFFADVFRREVPELLSPGADYDYSGLFRFEHFAAGRVGFADFESVSADSAGLRFCALKDQVKVFRFENRHLKIPASHSSFAIQHNIFCTCLDISCSLVHPGSRERSVFHCLVHIRCSRVFHKVGTCSRSCLSLTPPCP